MICKMRCCHRLTCGPSGSNRSRVDNLPSRGVGSCRCLYGDASLNVTVCPFTRGGESFWWTRIVTTLTEEMNDSLRAGSSPADQKNVALPI